MTTPCSSRMKTTSSRPEEYSFTDKKQLDINIFSRLEKVRNCCDTCNTTWEEWGKCIKDITCSIKGKPYECINALIKSLIKMQNLPREFLVDALVEKMEKDGAIADFLTYGLNKNDLNPFNLMKNENERNKFISILDSENITGSAKQYLNHFYSKIQMSRLNSQKEEEFLKLHTYIHRNYDPKNNGLYPFIKTDGSEYKIKKIDSSSSSRGKDQIYSCEGVKPYISNKKTPEERSALYDAQLVVKQLGHENLLPTEVSLSGQNGVFAGKDIPIGTCIGVHGGTLLFFNESDTDPNYLPMNILTKINQDYLVSISKRAFLDGNNIISKINSIFYKQSNGKWLESDEGYNAHIIKFGCEMEDGNKLCLHAIFTIQDIKKGEEIRMSYQYPSEIVNQAMRTNELMANIDIALLLKSIEKHTI